MAEFYKGFVFECDVSAPLTIEGNRIGVKRAQAGDGFTARLPSGKVIKAAIGSGARAPVHQPLWRPRPPQPPEGQMSGCTRPKQL